MVIFQIYVVGVAVLEAECHTPVRSYRHGPYVLTVALQWVQSKRRLVHILHLTSLIERRKDQPQTVNLIGSNFTRVVLFKQVPQALVLEAPDHPPTVKRKWTLVNTIAVASPPPALYRNLLFRLGTNLYGRRNRKSARKLVKSISI